MSTNTGHVMTLANSIIGVSVLAMPFCFKQCGITLAILLLIVSSIVTRLACHFLVKASMLVKRRNFEFLAFHAFGPSGKLFVELGVIGFMMGTCIAFFVVMGDLGPAIVSKIFEITNTQMLRSTVLIGVGLCVVLPLGLLRNVESLAAVSTITICFYVLLVVKIFFESSTHLVAGDWMDNVNFWRPEGFLQCFPIFAMALSCQTQIFEIFDNIPNASLDKMNSVVKSAVNMCTCVYIAVGLLGYVAFSSGNFAGNILLSFSPSFVTELYKLGFVLSLAVSFPLVIFPCRASLHSLLFRKMPVYHELSATASTYIPDYRFKYLTVAIVTVSMITGILIPNIELVLGFVGSTIGVAICIIFPSVAFVNLTSKDTNERLVAKVTFVAGIVIMVVGTYGNLYAANEVPVQVQLQLPLPRPDLALVKPDISLAKKNDVLSAPLVLADKPLVVLEPPNKPLVELKPEKRQEPPAPLPPKEIKKEVLVAAPLVDISKPKLEALLALPVVPSIKPSAKPVEIINRDAIAKEEQEEKEEEKVKKNEEENKKVELLKKLQEHADEQNKLLEEQQKILSDMKNRQPAKAEDPLNAPSEKPIKHIDLAKFSENIEKIQNVLEDLKDKKEIIQKEKMIDEKEKMIEKKEKMIDEKEKLIVEKERKIEEKEAGVVLETKNNLKPKKIASIPLPLMKLGNVQTKQEALGRDILAKDRQKRDVDEESAQLLGEECDKKSDNNIIRESAHLSVPDNTNLNLPPMSAQDGSQLDVAVPKKRDLKSIKTDEHNQEQ